MAKMRREGIQKIINNLENIDVKSIYNDLSLERQELIQPYVLPDEIYIKQWQDKTYVSKYFADDMPEIYTEKGERVRSKSEKIIADKLALMGIPYHYEYPLKLSGFGVVYPDFTLINKRNRKEYYLEHFGMMDNPEYSEKVIKKLDTYNKNGIYQGDKLLVTYETSKCPLNIRNVEKLMERYLL